MAITAVEAGKLKVFISYSRDDLKFADQLYLALDLTGFEATLDRHGIEGAEDWQKRLGDLILDADTVVFVLSPASAISAICAWEVGEAVRLGKRIIPVTSQPLSDAKPPKALQDLNYIYFYDEPAAPGSGFGAGLARLVPALNTDLGWIREHTRLLARATEWDAGGRTPYRLITGSDDIANAKSWAARRPKDAPEPTALHFEFIRESELAKDKAANDARQQLERMAAAQEEKARALDEKEAAVKAAADAQTARAAEQQRRAKLQRLLTAGAIAAAIGFGAFGVFSWNLSVTSEARRIEAEKLQAIANDQTKLATEQTKIAQAKSREAEEKKQEARKNLENEAKTAALFRANQADAALKGGDAVAAMLLALEALPDKHADEDYQRNLPTMPSAKLALQKAWKKRREIVVMSGHSGPVTDVEVSPDGSKIVSASTDGTARLWSLEGRLLAALVGHTSTVTRAVFSPGGLLILTASDDGTARLWDLKGREIAALDDHSSAVVNIAFSVDGSRILTSSYDGTARLWDADGKLVATLKGHTESVTSAVFSPDGLRILTTSNDTTAKLWEPDGKLLATLTGHENNVNSGAFSPDGSRIVTASSDNTARLWDAAGQPIGLLKGHGDTVNSAVFSADGAIVLTASNDKTAKIWDTALATGPDAVIAPLATLNGHGGSVSRADFWTSGTGFVTASGDKTIRTWNADGNLFDTFAGHRAGISDVAISPSRDRFASASEDNTVRLWSLSELGAGSGADQAVMTFKGHTQAIRNAAFSPDGSRVVTASDDGLALVSDTSMDSKSTVFLRGHDGPVTSALFSPLGDRILTASEDTTARLWDAAGKPLATLPGHGGTVRSAVFSLDGTRVVTAADDKIARLWDSNGKLLASLVGHDAVLTSAIFSPRGDRILTTSDDNSAQLWDPARVVAPDGALVAPLAILSGHEGTVMSASFSLNGDRILTASYDNTARLWDKDGKFLAKLKGHTGTVLSAVFSPDGTKVLTASADGTAALWEPPAIVNQSAKNDRPSQTPESRSSDASTSGAEQNLDRVIATLPADQKKLEVEWRRVIEFLGHEGSVYSAVFSKDGTRIVTASYDGTVRLWDVTGQLLDVFADHTDAVNSAVFSPDGGHVLTASSDATARLWTTSLASQDFVDAAKRALPRCFKEDERPQLHLSAKAPGWCEAAQKWPYDAPGKVADGKTKLVAEDWIGASADFQAAIRLSEAHDKNPIVIGEAQLGLGQAQERAGNKAAADLAFKDAERLGQNVGAIYSNKGYELLRDKKPDEAIVQFEEAMRWATTDVAHNATTVSAILGRARAHNDKKHYTSALAGYREAMDLGHRDAASWLWTVKSELSRQKRDQGALVEALLIAHDNYAGLNAEFGNKLEPTRIKGSMNSLTYPISMLNAKLLQTTGSDAGVTGCDMAAGHPLDPLLTGDGAPFDKIDAVAGITECSAAILQDGKQARFFLQRARAYSKSSDEAESAGDQTIASEHQFASLADLKTAMDLGYPMAFNNMGYAYENGEGVDKDEVKRGDFYLEFANRVMACCSVAVARHLLEVEKDFDGKAIRRVVHDMLQWAASLGDPKAHELLADLYTAGTLEPPAPQTAKPAAAGHLKIAEKLYTDAGQPADAQRAAASAGTLAIDIPDPSLAAMTATAAGFKPAAFTATPPWLAP